MATLIYIHGFLSSPLSFKAQQVSAWLSKNRPDIHYICPQLPPFPDQCASILDELIRNAESPIYLMGSSMGGFWATWFAEHYHLKAVLVNPAVDVLGLLPDYLNIELKNYHKDETYWLHEKHLQQLKQYCVSDIHHKDNYWLLVQMDDETLDYRLAVEKYTACHQTVEQGGDHSFQHFERYIADAIDFFESKGLTH